MIITKNRFGTRAYQIRHQAGDELKTATLRSTFERNKGYMSEQLTFIPASEAAEMVGVSAQTIRNLCKAKTIQYQIRGNMFYPCKEDVEKYAQSISEVNKIEVSIENYKRKMEQLYAQIREAKDILQVRLDEMNMFPERIHFIKEVFLASLHNYEGQLTKREIRMLTMVLEGEKLQDIAQKEQLACSRTRQILEKAIRRVACYSDRTKQMEATIVKQERTIRELQEKLFSAGKSSLSVEQRDLLQQSIFDLGFPVRIWIGLKVSDVETVGDLIKHQRSDFEDIRNFGKKSLEKLDDFLAAHNLSWGMQID